MVRLLETFESIKIVKQCVREIPDGPIDVEVREIPPGEAVGRVEAPRGETFHYVRSDGSNRPVRHKVRAPSYVNVPSFKASCIGATDLGRGHHHGLRGSLLQLHRKDGSGRQDPARKRLYTGEDLVRLSEEKTRRMRKEAGR